MFIRVIEGTQKGQIFSATDIYDGGFHSYLSGVYTFHETNVEVVDDDYVANLASEYLSKAQELVRARINNEQYDKLERLVKESLKDENMLWYTQHEDVYEQTIRLVNHYREQASKTYSVLASYFEHTLISLNAILLIVRQCSGLTHREKDVRMRVLEDTLQEAISNLNEDKERDYIGDTHYFHRGDWQTRRMVIENERMKFQIQELNKILQEHGIKVEKHDKTVQREEIPF